MRTRPRFVLPLLFLVTAALARPLHASDPTTADCLSASEASLKLRGEHKLREARGQLLVCASASCPADVRNECVRRVDPVNAAIPTIIFEAKDAAGNDMSAVTITMHGHPLRQSGGESDLARRRDAHVPVRGGGDAADGEDPRHLRSR